MINTWPLIGRAEELTLVTHALAAEHGSGIVIGGSAGVGKTRLRDAAVEAVSTRGQNCHRIAGTISSREVPLGAFAAIGFRHDADPLRQIRELIAKLTSCDNRSVIVAVDDAHLLDERSAFVVHELVVRRLANVLVTVRTGERVPDAITALWKDHDIARLELQPLSEDECRQLLERALGGRIESTSMRRFQTLSDGNAMLLRQLVEDELTAGRLRVVADVWLWSGEYTVTPTLADVVRRHMADLPDDVAYALDLLSICEPLDVGVLDSLVATSTLECAETMGTIVTESTGTGSINIKLAHPLQGDVRRTDLDRTTRERLAGIIADQLARQGDSAPTAILRRAVLALESDQPADPDMFAAATRAAMMLLDVPLAVRFASAGLNGSHSRHDAYPHVMTLVIAGQGKAAEDVLSSPTADLGDPASDRLIVLRAANLVWMLSDPLRAARLLRSVTARDGTTRAEVAAVNSGIHAVLAHPMEAIVEARSALDSGLLSDFYALLATAAFVMSSGAIGDIDGATQCAQRGYDRATSSWQTAHLQFWLAAIHARACRVAGKIDLCLDESARFSELSRDVPALTHVQGVFLHGHSELAAGRLESAVPLLLDCLAGTRSTPSDSTGLRSACLIWLAEARAVTGDIDSARATLDQFDAGRPAHYAFMESGTSLAAAWCAAAEGDTDRAIRLASDTADTACVRGQHGYEVVALQTAVQFGHAAVADRLRALASLVGGPRASIAARHAAALRDGDGAVLLEVAGQYESMGDRIAAADTAAQSGSAFSANNQRGFALLAFETARRLAAECGCGSTPALSRTQPAPFTDRQREIISLVAEGMSNSDIARSLTMSVRSVEGHLYRAAQRAGVSGRAELAAIHRGYYSVTETIGGHPVLG